jgi:hypothetical protein
MPDIKTGGIGAGVGIVGLVVGMFIGGDKTEMVETITISDKLAICTVDSMTPESEKTYTRIDEKDTTKTITETVTVAPRPALKGFSVDGISDYAIAKIMEPGKKYQLLLTEDGVVIDATEYSDLKMKWLLSIRPTAIVQEE